MMTYRIQNSKIKAAIFDIDGTILDSVPIWNNLSDRYLLSLGITPEPNLGKKMAAMSTSQGGDYLRDTYHIPKSSEQIQKEVLGIIADFYKYEAPLKTNAQKLLERIPEEVPFYLATSSDRELVTLALKRVGVWDRFQGLLTCSELDTDKSKPDIFFEACRKMGTRPEETAVVEDSLYAIKTAKAAGFYIIAVYDEESQGDWPQICKLADETLR